MPLQNEKLAAIAAQLDQALVGLREQRVAYAQQEKILEGQLRALGELEGRFDKLETLVASLPEDLRQLIEAEFGVDSHRAS